ncbi:MAG: hypothetical protein CVU18_21655 [Betaproteobacteria bacterium HGW-Betaproteobacteria-12]|nr:MAG: hypothetical protein CVU18_21655 [Betaproteobacteria bacterium HGW-Betaproteobacteria-12]
MSTASLHVTKLAAAKRQLQSAIRLFFLEEDELAIHTIASAVYGLLKDLKRDRGQSEAADSYRTTFFYLVRDFRRGTLPAHFTSDPSTMAEVERIADQLSPITADSKLSDVQATIPSDLEKRYWNEINRAANFLKHADRDTSGTLQLEEVDNNLLLLKCCSAYRDIAPDDLGNEGWAFEAFTAANNPSHQATGSTFDSLVASMRRVPREHRLELCYKVIIELNARRE